MTDSDAFISISITSLLNFISPILSTKKAIAHAMVLLLKFSDAVAMWLKISIIAFTRFKFDVLKSLVLALTNFATASRI